MLICMIFTALLSAQLK